MATPEQSVAAGLVELAEFEALAVTRMSQAARVMVQGGAGAMAVANTVAWQRWAVRQRALIDVTRCDVTTSVLGQAIALPVMIAPSGHHEICHPEAELATARAASRSGTAMVLSMATSRAPEEVGAISGPFWMQLYWGRERALVRDVVNRATAAGASALCLTVDMPVRPPMSAEMRRAQEQIWRLPTPLMPVSPHTGGRLSYHDPALTWSDLEWLREVSDLPIVLKGIMCAGDAKRAAEHGASAIIVSNHGGRVLEGGLATADVLPEIVESVGGELEVLVDGGIRSGTDVFRALALGARAVLIGRPALWGLTVDGADGAAKVLELLKLELETVMAMAGARELAEICSSTVQAIRSRNR